MTSGIGQGLLSSSASGGSSGGGGGGGYPPGGPTVDNHSPGVNVTLTANLVTWNLSESATGQNQYILPVDTAPTSHIIGWESGTAPLISCAGGTWKLINPLTGGQVTTYTYSIAGEQYTWVADPTEKLFWPL